jgi:hypothetical protein
MRQPRSSGPSALEVKLRGDLDRARRELTRLKKAAEGGAEAAEDEGLTGEERTELGRLREDMHEIEQLRTEAEASGMLRAQLDEFERVQSEVEDLRHAKERLSKLYYAVEPRASAPPLQQIITALCNVSSTRPDSLLPAAEHTGRAGSAAC